MDSDQTKVDLLRIDIDPESAAQARAIQGSAVVMPVRRVDGGRIYAVLIANGEAYEGRRDRREVSRRHR